MFGGGLPLLDMIIAFQHERKNAYFTTKYDDNAIKTCYVMVSLVMSKRGRFINEDTYEGKINNPLSLNLYTYGHNNPLKYIDPSGHSVILPDYSGGSDTDWWTATKDVARWIDDNVFGFFRDANDEVSKNVGYSVLYGDDIDTLLDGDKGYWEKVYTLANPFSGIRKLDKIDNAIKPVKNMDGFFDMKFGKSFKKSSLKTNVKYDGQSIYKITEKISNNKYLKKGYGIYLDGMHKDHLEVIDKQGYVKYVLNLDGTLNADKTKKALGRQVKEWRQ
jgi:RHS repeat-associated protein